MNINTRFHIVGAFTHDFIMGVNGNLPWKSPEDMRFFRELTSPTIQIDRRSMGARPPTDALNLLTSGEPRLTLHKAVLMGYNTFQSIGRYLPDRVNLVVDRNVEGMTTLREGEAYHVADLSTAVDWVMGKFSDVYVIGGEKLFTQFINFVKHHPYVDLHHIHLTKIHPSALLPPYLDSIQSESAEITRFPIEQLFHDSTRSIKYRLEVAYTSPTSKNEYMIYALDPTTYEQNCRRGEFGYLQLLDRVLREGEICEDRTGVGTLSLFGHQLEFDLNEGTLPLLTTKKVFLKGVIHELLWFLRGETDSKILEREGVGIWKGNTSRVALDRLLLDDYAEGEGGPIYGHQFRHFGAKWEIDDGGHRRVLSGGVDQVEEVLQLLRTAPHSRRIMINLWNPVDLDEMALPPCHVLYQFRVYGGKLSCSMYQRSCDSFLGLPFNICSTALMTYIFSHLTGLVPGKIVMSFGDVHIYRNHLEAVQKQLCRRPFPFPKMMIEDRGQRRVEDFVPSDFVVSGYLSHGAIPAPMAV